MNQDSLVQALRLLRECGYVILEAVLPVDWVENMRCAYNEEVKRQFVGEKPTGHSGISAPFYMPFLDPLTLENPFAMQILKEAMGDDIFSYFPYGSNTAWPGCGVQHIHRDTGHLFPNEPYVLPISLAVVNIALTDFTEENGATEVWPSSHLITECYHNDSSTLEERAIQLPSIRVIMPAGSVVVRDMRFGIEGCPIELRRCELCWPWSISVGSIICRITPRLFGRPFHLRFGNRCPRNPKRSIATTKSKN